MSPHAPRRRIARRVFALAVSLLAVGLFAPEAFASSGPTLTVTARPHHPGKLTLVARLGGGAGKSVAFFVVTKEFGQPKDVPIGVAKTAKDGSARVSYEPTWSGREQFVARPAGPGGQTPTATASYRVTASAPGPLAAAANPPRPLADVGGVFLDSILTVVALVWLSLIAVLAVAFGWMPRLAAGGTD